MSCSEAGRENLTGKPKVSYDHAKKVGNKGDVWKHFILLTVLRQLIEERENRSDRFRYFESHAGQGVYHLKQQGEWK